MVVVLLNNVYLCIFLFSICVREDDRNYEWEVQLQWQLFRSTMASINWVTSSRPLATKNPEKDISIHFSVEHYIKLIHLYINISYRYIPDLAFWHNFFTLAGHLVAKGTVRFIQIIRMRLTVAKGTVRYGNSFANDPDQPEGLHCCKEDGRSPNFFCT